MTAPDLLQKIHRAAGAIATEGLSLGVIVVDKALRVIYWNGWMEKHSGIREAEILGQGILDRWPDIRQRGKDGYLIDCVERRRTALLSPLLHGYFLPLPIVRDQQAIQMFQSVKIYPFLDDERPAGAVIVIQDMTEGILHEKEIHRLTRILDGIRNLNKLMVRVETEDGLLQGACDILVRSIGYPAAWIGMWHLDEPALSTVAATPRPADETVPDPCCDKTCPALLAEGPRTLTPADGPHFKRARLGFDAAGAIRTIHCLPLRSEQRIIGVLHILSEDPKPFQAEESQLLEEYASDVDYAVETLVDRRRRKAAEEALRENEIRLRQSQKMEAIGVLAGGIAHDFNNILYPIIGFSEMISDETAAGAPEREYVDEVLKAAYRARDLVQQILAFSRQSDQAPEPVFLAPIIKESLQLMRASLPSSIEIRADIDQRCGPVLADPTHIYQVVMNLCANAFQAMEETGGQLTITLREASLIRDGDPEDGTGGKTYVRLSVKDTGPGMDPAVRERIFEPYFTTKDRGKGTGMGLSVVHGIVERMGGHIEVASAPGAGATFHLYLPRKTASTESVGKADPPPTASVQARGAERILLVDDEIQNLRVMETMLADLGYASATANDGREALERFRENPAAFDLVITDLTMPGLGGDALARELTRIRPDVPVILCTGYREKITVEEARSLGIRRLLDKPMGNRLLAEAIRDVLDGNEE